MLELMLAGNNVTIVPGSGPGNKKLLAGDKTNGWFGMIDAGEMPIPQEILTMGGGGIASLPNQATVPLRWMKAVINGKYIFVANTPFNIYALLDIYNRGQIFGTDDIGISPPSNRYNDQNQLQIVTYTDKVGKVWAFKLRTLSHSSNDKPTSTSVTTTELAEAESFKLYSHIISGVTPDDGKRWDNLVNGVDYYAAWSTSRTVFGTYFLSRAQNGNRSTGTWYANNTSYNWFPVLEVIDPDVDIIPPVNIAFETISLSGTGTIATSDAITMTPSELGMLPQTEVAPHVKESVDNAIAMVPSELAKLDHAERPPFMK